jgi:hypothetical protein
MESQKNPTRLYKWPLSFEIIESFSTMILGDLLMKIIFYLDIMTLLGVIIYINKKF